MFICLFLLGWELEFFWNNLIGVQVWNSYPWKKTAFYSQHLPVALFFFFFLVFVIFHSKLIKQVLREGNRHRLDNPSLKFTPRADEFLKPCQTGATGKVCIGSSTKILLEFATALSKIVCESLVQEETSWKLLNIRRVRNDGFLN